MTPGQVVSTSALAGMVFGPVARLADLAYVFEQTAASVDRLGEILDLEPDVREPSQEEIQALPDSAGKYVARSSSTEWALDTCRASRSSGTSA